MRSNIHHLPAQFCRGQFCNGETSKQKATQKISSQNCSTSRRNKSKKPMAEDVLHSSEGWVDPKSSAAVPKNAGKRRVHANGQSAGHWYTSPEGRKVYVTKTGQELTGQIAYRHYRKESGARRRKTKKKKQCQEAKRVKINDLKSFAAIFISCKCCKISPLHPRSILFYNFYIPFHRNPKKWFYP
ncbi:hypothetical protein SLA2020_322050 [Shorea laevis]